MPTGTLGDAQRDYLTILAEPFPCQECRLVGSQPAASRACCCRQRCLRAVDTPCSADGVLLR